MRRHHLPDKVELCILVCIVIACTFVVGIAPSVDVGLSLLSIPVFISAAVMGLRRNWRLTEINQSPPQSQTPVAE